MASDAAKGYILPHDPSESELLNTQHEAFIASPGFVLHPRIFAYASSLTEHPRVVDVATGTGAWLLDLEREVKDAPLAWELSALDINPDQFPTSATASTDCQFSILDIRQPIPQHLRGFFHVVHIRMLLGGLITSDWSLVAENVYHLLKPGGWIQWHEIDATSIRAYPGVTAPTAETQGSQTLLDICVSRLQRVGKFMAEDMQLFQERVAEAGFSNVEIQRPSSDRTPEMREQSSLAMCEAVSAAWRQLSNSGSSIALPLEIVEGMITRSKQELEGGRSYWRWDMYIVTGQKAHIPAL